MGNFKILGITSFPLHPFKESMIGLIIIMFPIHCPYSAMESIRERKSAESRDTKGVKVAIKLE